MDISVQRSGTIWLVLMSIAIMSFAFLSSDGLYNIDEHMYVMAGETYALYQTLLLPALSANYSQDSIDQMLIFFGPNGPTVQYPIGMTLLGSLVLPWIGARGLILVNAAAIIVTIFLTRALARLLYRDEKIALSAALLFAPASFAIEYAFGIWPHGISACLVIGALYAAVVGISAAPRSALLYAICAGALVGLGFLFRVDTILILPLIGCMIILVASHPARMILGGVVGMAPFLIATSLTNAFRFGTYNPLSYGRSGGGGTDASNHLITAGILVCVIILLVFIRQFQLNRRYPRALLLGALVVAAASFSLSEAREIWEKIALGAYNLLIDIRGNTDPRTEWVVKSPNGTTSFWGLGKKALGQSMPWIAIVLALFAMRWSTEDRRSHLILLFGSLLWMLPFFMLDWHGGMSNNTRYFMPVVPLVAILAAYVWITIFDGDRLSAVSYLAFIAAGGAPILIWAAYADTGLHGAQQILPLYYLVGMAIFSLSAYLPGHMSVRLRPLAQRGFVACLGAAMVLTFIIDIGSSQARREHFLLVSKQSDNPEATPSAPLGQAPDGAEEPQN